MQTPPLSDKKRERTEDDEEEAKSNKKVVKVACDICMEESDTVEILPEHNCNQCKKDSWRVCVLCDDNLLSRKCPICQGDYKPWILHAIPEIPIFPFDFTSSKNPQEKYAKTVKIQILCDILMKSNVAIWRPDESNIYFSLPKDLSATPKDMEMFITYIPIQKDRIIENSMFYFNNSVWDEIENTIENTNNTATTTTTTTTQDDNPPDNSAANDVHINSEAVLSPQEPSTTTSITTLSTPINANTTIVSSSTTSTTTTTIPISTTLNEIEGGIELPASQALKWILQKAQTSHALILTRVTPLEWNELYSELLTAPPNSNNVTTTTTEINENNHQDINHSNTG